MSDNRIPDLLTVMLIPIPRPVIPDPGAVIPDPTPFFAFDLWSHIPCFLRPWLVTISPPMSLFHGHVAYCKGNVGAFPRDKENWPYHSDVKLLHCVNQVRPICWKCWVLRIILRNFGSRIINSFMVHVRPICVENETLLKWNFTYVFKNLRERSWDSFSRAM